MAYKLLTQVETGRSARVSTIVEMILKNRHSVLQIVVCVSLLIAALYIIMTPNHSGTIIDWAIGVLGMMVGRILKW